MTTKEGYTITNPYDGLTFAPEPYKSGKEKRRERRAKRRKHNK